MSPDKLMERVQKLLAMTQSSFEEEARTSALMACRLIRQHNLLQQKPQQKQSSSFVMLELQLKIARREQQELRSQVERLEEELKRTKSRSAQTRGSTCSGSRSRSTETEELRAVAFFDSKFNAVCRTCGERIKVGDPIAWHGKGAGSSCARHY